jgi:hypothetical protein
MAVWRRGVKGIGMAISRRNLSVALQFFLAALSVAASLLLAFSYPEVGKALNPFIALAIYLLPVLACMLIANAIYLFFLNSMGLPARNLADTLVQTVMRHWRDQDARRIARESSKLENNPEIEQRPDL